jgi:hypothetical protein
MDMGEGHKQLISPFKTPEEIQIYTKEVDSP